MNTHEAPHHDGGAASGGEGGGGIPIVGEMLGVLAPEEFATGMHEQLVETPAGLPVEAIVHFGDEVAPGIKGGGGGHGGGEHGGDHGGGHH
ncbi:MAG TPA: hypothetical protein VE973_01975 [Candidatus Limnocylindria bacterium]|nr:hypothetical protein [Candidatus Limnocylindria bacterium]